MKVYSGRELKPISCKICGSKNVKCLVEIDANSVIDTRYGLVAKILNAGVLTKAHFMCLDCGNTNFTWK